MAGFSQGRPVVNADEKKKRKLTGQMAFFFLEIQMENIGSFFLYNLHDELKHRKKIKISFLKI